MPDLNTIPATKSDDELAALKAADPAAFDLDEAPPQSDEEKAAAELAEKEAAEKAEADAAAKLEAEKAEEAKKADVIPKGRFNEALRERDEQRVRAEAAEAELAALKKGPAVDYGDEIKKLDAAWNSDDEDAFKGTHAEYLEQRDALLVQKAEADALVKFQAEQDQRDAKAKLTAWETEASAFVGKHDEYADREGVDFQNFNKALKLEFVDNPNGTFQQWLDAAHTYAQTRAIVEGRAQVEPKADAKTDPKGPHDDRNKADAAASTKASAAPKTVAGGVSSAGGPIGNIDMANLRPGQFSKLSRDQQAAALGSPDAL